MKPLKIKHFLFAAVAGAAALGAPESARAAAYDGKLIFYINGLCVHPEGRRNSTKDNTRLILHSDACKGSDVRLGFRLENHSGGYKVIRHPYSGKCVHPRGGDNPKNGTDLVLYGGDCGLWKTKFKFHSNGLIQHAQSKKCVYPKGGSENPKRGTRLVLEDDCTAGRKRFDADPPSFRVEEHRKAKEYDVNGRLFHIHSGLCVHPQGRRNDTGNDTRLILHSDACDGLESRLAFVMQKNGSILHPFSGKCFHPKGGSTNPGNNTPVVLYDGCNHKKNEFRMISSGAIVHVPSGKCVHPKGGRGKKGAHLILWGQCLKNHHITFHLDNSSPRPHAGRETPNWGRLIHTLSGSCIQPKGGKRNPGNKHPLVFSYKKCRDKRDQNPEFEMLASGAIRHRSGKCIHPKGGKDFPGDRTLLHLYDGCRAGYVKFKYHDGVLFQTSSGMCIQPDRDKDPVKPETHVVLRRPQLRPNTPKCYRGRHAIEFVPTFAPIPQADVNTRAAPE